MRILVAAIQMTSETLQVAANLERADAALRDAFQAGAELGVPGLALFIAIIVSVYAANVHRGVLIFAVVLAIPALLERIVLPKLNSHSFFIFNILLTLIFDVMIIVIIFRHVLAERQPTSETIFGALCLYLLVGFTFASVYGLVGAFQPNAFYLDPHINLHAAPDRFDLIYYSFATMTSSSRLKPSSTSPRHTRARPLSARPRSSRARSWNSRATPSASSACVRRLVGSWTSHPTKATAW